MNKLALPFFFLACVSILFTFWSISPGQYRYGAILHSSKLVGELKLFNASRAEAASLRNDLAASRADVARLNGEISSLRARLDGDASSSRADAKRLIDELAVLRAAAAAAAAAASAAANESASISGILAGFHSPWWKAVAGQFSASARQQKWLGVSQSCAHVRGPRKQLRAWTVPCSRDVVNLVFWRVPYNADPMSWQVGAANPRMFDEPALAVWAESVKRNIGIAWSLPAGMVPDNEYFFPPKPADTEEFTGDMCGIPGLRVATSSRNRAVLNSNADFVLIDYPFAMTGNEGLLPPVRDGLSFILQFESESTEYYPHVTTPAFQAHFHTTIGIPQSFFTYAGKPIWPYTTRGADLAKTPSPQLARLLEAGGWPASGGALAATMVTNCAAKNSRGEYIEELMKYMRVDSFGGCKNNAKVDDAILARYSRGNDSPSSHFSIDYRGVKRELFAKYPFVLAFENANCYDWVTEKPYDALLAGSVPIYMGAPNVNDYLPPNSYIDVRFFSGPAELAAFLAATAADPVAYGAFHEWRKDDASAWPWIDDALDGETTCSVIQSQWENKCGGAPVATSSATITASLTSSASSTAAASATGTAAAAATSTDTATGSQTQTSSSSAAVTATRSMAR